MENMLAFCFHQFVWPEKKIVVCNTCIKDVKLLYPQKGDFAVLLIATYIMEIKLAC